MKQVKVTFNDNLPQGLPVNFDFRNNDSNEFLDFEVVEIIPIDEHGKQICPSQLRNVILTHASVNGEPAWYEATIKTEKHNNGMYNFLEVVKLSLSIFSEDFEDVNILTDYEGRKIVVVAQKDGESYMSEISFDDVFLWSDNHILSEQLIEIKEQLLND